MDSSTTSRRLEDLSEPTPREIRQFCILTLVSVIVSLGFLFCDFEISQNLAVDPGKAVISVYADSEGILVPNSIEEIGPVSSGAVAINSAILEQLLACPGIGPVIADNIIKQRMNSPFSSWENFRERVPGIGKAKINRLREVGVTLDP